MAKRATKAAIKKAAYDETMKSQPAKARWVKHEWDEKTNSVRTVWLPGCFPAAKGWNREGSIDEIEARENAGQRSLF